jgi:hypothetical protein
MSLPELRTRVWELGQAYFEGAADGFSLCESIEETLDLYEDFYILDALNKPWGHGAHFKCTKGILSPSITHWQAYADL